MRVWLSPSAFAPHRGGVEEVTLRLGQQLSAAGDEVLVVTNRWPLDLPQYDVVEDLEVLRLPFLLPAARPSAVARYATARSRIRSDLEAAGPAPDVVHVHCASSQLPALGSYARRHHVPLVLSTHGETEMDAHGLFESSAFMRWVLRREASKAYALTACSQWAATAAARIAPGFSEAEVVLNGVDPAHWPMTPVPDEPVIAAWGRHVHQKGFDLLLNAFQRVRTEEPDAQLLLGGSGPETAQLSKLAGEGVELLGELDRANVTHTVARARVVAVPSRVEPFGMVAVEALAAGRGLVYAAGTGLTEAAGGLGRAVDVRDERALASALLAELRSPTRPIDGRAWAAGLSWDQVAAKYRRTYPQRRR